MTKRTSVMVVLAVVGALVFPVDRPAAAAPATVVTAGTPRIVGGVGAAAHAYPWMVRLSMGCGGALVASRVVLTAAHCVPRTGATGGIRVTGGAADLGSSQAVTVSSTYVLRAPGFVAATRGNDWALVRLAKPLAGPVLPLTPSAAYDRGQFRIFGWGATFEGGPQQRVLRTAVVGFVPDGACRRAYGRQLVAAQMICAGNLAHGGVDACQGDSGGPMVHPTAAGGLVEVGIVSWGAGCARAGYPGVYTQVSAFTKTIDAGVARLAGP